VLFEGRDLNFRALWRELGVDVGDDETGEFSNLKFCPNPDHSNDRSPAFQVNLRKPLVHCFSRCGIEGNYLHAVQVVRGCTETEARRFIKGFTRVALGVDIEPAYSGRKRAVVETDSPLAVAERRLDRGEFVWLPKHAREYLTSRGIDDAARGKWQVGWDEDEERIVIPAHDERGRFRFLIRRSIDGRRPKYLYTEGYSKTDLLFGADKLDTDQVCDVGLVLVEGSIDTIKLDTLGLSCAAAILGSGLSERQVRIIDSTGARRVYLMFDGDAAGLEDVLAAAKKIVKTPLFVCRYRNGKKDPGELAGNEPFEMIERAMPMGQFKRRLAEMARKTRSTTKEVRVGT
jgi:DNA primase